MTVQILHGDCIAMMKTLADNSVDIVVTSPPYWGLRDYDVEGQHGLEESLGKHLEQMREVFREVWRVLKPTGTVWLNYGDCYATQPNGRSAEATKAAGTDDRTFRDKPFSTVGPINRSRDIPRGAGRWGGGNNGAGPIYADEGVRKRTTGGMHGDRREDSGGRVFAGGYLKPKDLCMIPNRLAILLQEDGWWVRSEIIWAKTNPMPDSCGISRPSTSHEKIWMLSKSGDTTCWRARDTGEWSFKKPDMTQRLPIKRGKKDDTPRWRGFDFYYNAESVKLPCSEGSQDRLSQDVESQTGSTRANGGKKTNGNMKAVVGPQKQDGHSRRHESFNARWEAKNQPPLDRFLRNYEISPMQVWEMATQPCSFAHFATFPPELVERCLMAGCPPGGVVLDPYGGAGTTGLVADQLGMSAILCELNEEYIEIATTRLRAGLVRVKSDVKDKHALSGTMFEGLEPCS